MAIPTSDEVDDGPPGLIEGPVEHVGEGVRFHLETVSPRAGRPITMRLVVTEEDDTSPVTDLEPYIGAAAPLLLVDPRVTMGVHGHPEGPFFSGPVINFSVLVPMSGAYKLWIQAKHRGGVITAPFVIAID